VRVRAVVAAGVLALLSATSAHAYGWPLEPFDEPHAIRGSFDDPRVHIDVAGHEIASFHFGIDIPAAGGTPVYSVAPGTVYRYPDAVAVRESDGHEFSYWHVDAAVSEHQHVREHELIGWVKASWAHVHFAELEDGAYVNPLRPGALEPYFDTTTPTVAWIGADGNGIVADVYDTPPLTPPSPWQDARLTPALIRWRIDGGEWQTAADFRRTLLPATEFDSIYARGTWQNKPFRAGRYLFWLAHDVAAGTYRVEVAAEDLAGNVGTLTADVTVQTRSKTNSLSPYTRGKRPPRRFSSPRRSTR
jgi:murein DD-endopeptidase MepM/ murein hydrolase activator NlpD